MNEENPLLEAAVNEATTIMIPRDKPKDIRWDVEWVAMHTDFHFPEVTDVGFLAAFKKVMIEVAGDRLYDYRAAEQVEEYLTAGSHSCPMMEREAAAEGFTRYSKIKDFIRLEMEFLCEAADQWRKQTRQGKPLTVDYSDILEREVRQSAEAYANRKPD